MKPNNALVHVPEFHQVLLFGTDYITMGCCGNELFSVVRDHNIESRHHIIVMNVGYACSIDNSTGMLNEDPVTIQNYLIEHYGEDTMIVPFDTMSESDVQDLMPTCTFSNCPVTFKYEDEQFGFGDDLVIFVNGQPKTFDQISADKKYVFTIVKNLIEEALKD